MQGNSNTISPQVIARTAGVLYLLVIILGGFAYGYVPGRLVADDVAVTARNILVHESLWRAAIVADLIVVACAIPQLLCEYLLIRPVRRNLALLAVFFNILSLSIESISGLAHGAALYLLKGTDSVASVFSAPQRQSLAALAIDLHDYDVNISFVFFGCFCLVFGYLIFRSGFLPRFLGVLMMLAGLCYAANSMGIFLGFNLAAGGFPWLLVPAGLSELILCLWLLIKGVDVAKWHAKAS